MTRFAPRPAAGFGSKTDAVVHLREVEGLSNAAIAERIGSTELSVAQLYSLAKKAGRAAWTPEKRDKARRLVARSMAYIAEALGVSVRELVGEGLSGTVRPVSIAPLVQLIESDGADAPGADAALSEDEPETFGPEGWAELPEPDADDRARDEAELAAIEGDAAEETEEEDEPVASAPAKAAALFKLRSEAGDYLHQHTRGMTRLPKFFWRGTADEIRSLKRKKPQLRDLIEEGQA